MVVRTKEQQIQHEKHWQTLYYLRNNPVNHHAKCQSEVCINQRTAARISPRDRYVNGRYKYCGMCQTPYPSSIGLRCPCCSHVMRIRSKYAKSKEQQVVRY